jgi:hypothetical protein
MDTLITHGAGMDVHQKEIVVCIIVGPEGKEPQVETRTFPTMTRDLYDLLRWLESRGITHIAMESTGIYWKPVYNILEGYFEIILANAHRIKNVPGRKTDVSDAEWIARLLRHGLIESSFVPPPDIRELRELTRLRKKWVGHLTAEKNRIRRAELNRSFCLFAIILWCMDRLLKWFPEKIPLSKGTDYFKTIFQAFGRIWPHPDFEFARFDNKIKIFIIKSELIRG